MPSELPRPTDVELQVLEVFWDLGPSTVRAVHNHLVSMQHRRHTSYSTTLKMIQVLHEKGFVTRDESVRPQVYQAVVSREETQRSFVKDVAVRLFGGAMTDLVQCAISSGTVSDAELREIQALIRDAKSRGGRS